MRNPRRRTLRGGDNFANVDDACNQILREPIDKVRKLYLKASRQFHPDKFKGESQAGKDAATKDFQRLSECYQKRIHPGAFVPDEPPPAPRPAAAPARAAPPPARAAPPPAPAAAAAAAARQRAADEEADRYMRQAQKEDNERRARAAKERADEANAKQRRRDEAKKARAAAEDRRPDVQKERIRMANMFRERHEERNAQVDREEAMDYANEQKRVYDRALKDFRYINDERAREGAVRRVVAEYMAEFTDYAQGDAQLRGARAVLAALNQTLAEYAARNTPAEDVTRVQAAQREANERVIELSRRRGGATHLSSSPTRRAMRSSSAERRTYSRRRRA